MMNDVSELERDYRAEIRQLRYESLAYLNQQMKVHPEYITEADEEQLKRIAQLVEGVDHDE